jgi:dTDP-4-amino-4,6-dideoxygalactose transaminase
MSNEIVIPFNIPAKTGHELAYIKAALNHHTMSGNGKYTQLCERWFENHFKCAKALLVTSCTHALEMAALLLDIQPGDEVIMPSYTFVSTANAFALRGAQIVFIDIDPKTMNMDPQLLEPLITSRTKCIVPVHYAGVSCDMESIMKVADFHGIKVVEDAAQCMGSNKNGSPVGTKGHLATFSFHETKNITSAGEGGMLVINDKTLALRAEIIREKGTNRGQFFRGEIDKYSWVDIGSSYLLGELNAAYLYCQLQALNEISSQRITLWKTYYQNLQASKTFILPPEYSSYQHNAHIFYVKVKEPAKRPIVLKYLRNQGIEAVFHYVPLHSSIMGKKNGLTPFSMAHTELESSCLFRLPLYHGLTDQQIQIVSDALLNFSH